MEKCEFCGFLKPMFSLFRKACLLYKTSKIVFHYFFSRPMTWEYRGLQGVPGGYKGLQGVTGGYKGLQRVTGGYRRLQRIIETLFWVERSQILFLKLFCQKNQIWRNLKLLTKTMDYSLWKNSNFAFFINSCFYSL